MFQIKICGITNRDDALLAADLGADAIGLNFYEKSPRYLHNPADVIAAIPSTVSRVGVFVNPSLPSLKKTLGEVSLTALQLHGDEPAELFEEIAMLARTIVYDQISVIRAFRCSFEKLPVIAGYLAQLERLNCQPAAVLLDAYDAGAYGGTGKFLDWSRLHAERSIFSTYPLILAGGLTPDNVADAILTARPDAVDVASGVESSPGKKDPSKLRDFIAAVKSAFTQLAKA